MSTVLNPIAAITPKPVCEFDEVEKNPKGFLETLKAAILSETGQSAETLVTAKRELTVVDATEFIQRELPPRPMLLEPFLQEKSIGMIHAWRGVGKTHVTLGIAAAEASGGTFLKWKAPKPVPILYIDGEMAEEDIQAWLKDAFRTEGIPPIQPGYFNLVTPDQQDGEIPSLLTTEGQELVESKIGNAKHVIFDNISSLFRGGREKEDQDWNIAQDWLLSLRRRGIATLLVHHDGKQGTQRGTSKREDQMNWVLHLKHPKDYNPEQGLRAEVHFEKARRLFGPDARPFEVQLTAKDGKPLWTIKELEDAMFETIRALHEDQGLSFRAIAAEIDKTKSYVERAYNKGKAKTNPECPTDVPNDEYEAF